MNGSNGQALRKETQERLGTIELVNQVGMRVQMGVSDIEDAYAVMRWYGGAGWTSGEVPAGGFRLPYAMANTFCFALIGAREFEFRDDDGNVCHALSHRGSTYKRREYAASTKGKKMPAAVKYSRGALPTDPPHLKEGEESGAQFVTLITFKGAGRSIPELEKRGAPVANEEREKPRAVSTAQSANASPDQRSPSASGILVHRARALGVIGAEDGIPALREYARAQGLHFGPETLGQHFDGVTAAKSAHGAPAPNDGAKHPYRMTIVDAAPRAVAASRATPVFDDIDPFADD